MLICAWCGAGVYYGAEVQLEPTDKFICWDCTQPELKYLQKYEFFHEEPQHGLDVCTNAASILAQENLRRVVAESLAERAKRDT